VIGVSSLNEQLEDAETAESIETVVQKMVLEFKKKLRGIGGEISLQEKIEKTEDFLATLEKMREQNSGEDQFFSSGKFETTKKWLGGILSETQKRLGVGG
jgi:hypothetical protein